MRHFAWISLAVAILACSEKKTQFGGRSKASLGNLQDLSGDAQISADALKPGDEPTPDVLPEDDIALPDTPDNNVQVVEDPEPPYPLDGGSEAVVDLKINGSDGPLEVRAGVPMTVSWTISGVEQCESPLFDTLPADGQIELTPSADTSYELKCQSAKGELVDFVVISLQEPQPAPEPTPVEPSADLLVNDSSSTVAVASGDIVVITWNTTGELTCSLSDHGAVEASGMVERQISETTDITLSCQDAAGELHLTDSVRVEMETEPTPTPPPVVEVMIKGSDAAEAEVTIGSEVEVYWNAENVDECVMTPDTISFDAGSHVFQVLSETTIAVSCSAGDKTVSDAVSFSLTPPPPETPKPAPPTVALKVVHAAGEIPQGSNFEVPHGESVRVIWQGADADDCQVLPFGFSGLNGDEEVHLTSSGPISVTCTASNESVTSSIDVMVAPIPPPIPDPPPPPPAPWVVIRANNLKKGITVDHQEKVKISWNAKHADSCQLRWSQTSKNVPLKGRQFVKLAAKTSFEIECQAGDQVAVSSILVNVRPPKTPSVSLTVNGKKAITIETPQEVELSYSGKHFKDCQLAGKNYEALAKTVSVSVNKTKSYRVVCNGPHGKAKDEVTINYKEREPPVVQLTLNDKPASVSVPYGSALKVKWAASKAQACKLEPYGDATLTGSQKKVFEADTKITMTCTNGPKTTIVSRTVTVRPLPAPGIQLRVDGKSAKRHDILYGKGFKLTWKATNIHPYGACVDPLGGRKTTGSHTGTIKNKPLSFRMHCKNHAGIATTVVTTLRPIDVPKTVNLSGAEIQKTVQADIIIAFDNSGSMGDEKEWLGKELGEMFNSFFTKNNLKQENVHIHLLLDDEKFKLSLDKKYYSSFTQYKKKVGSHDSLKVLKSFLKDKNASAKIRQNSIKEILIITDDDVEGDYDAKKFVNDLDTDKYRKKTRVNGFIGFKKGESGKKGCKIADRGDHYFAFKDKAPNWTGNMYDLCSDDWGKLIKTLADNIVKSVLVNRFKLSPPADPTKDVTVKVNGKALRNGQDFSLEDGGVNLVFKKGPGLKDIVTVKYVGK